MEELYRLFPTEIARDGSKAKLLKSAVRRVGSDGMKRRAYGGLCGDGPSF